MRGKITVVLVVAGLVFASAAVAATSPPVGGGRYKGTDDSTAFVPINHSVTLAVTKSKANFASGRINLWLKGQGGLGSCAGPAYVTLSPTHARQITTSGTFDLHGHFTYRVPTPYGPQPYAASVTIKGGFSDLGKQVAGTLRETARSKGLTCSSGTVHFTAALVK